MSECRGARFLLGRAPGRYLHVTRTRVLCRCGPVSRVYEGNSLDWEDDGGGGRSRSLLRESVSRCVFAFWRGSRLRLRIRTPRRSGSAAAGCQPASRLGISGVATGIIAACWGALAVRWIVGTEVYGSFRPFAFPNSSRSTPAAMSGNPHNQRPSRGQYEMPAKGRCAGHVRLSVGWQSAAKPTWPTMPNLRPANGSAGLWLNQCRKKTGLCRFCVLTVPDRLYFVAADTQRKIRMGKLTPDGSRIREFRKRKNLPQKTIAAVASVSEQLIRDVEQKPDD